MPYRVRVRGSVPVELTPRSAGVAQITRCSVHAFNKFPDEFPNLKTAACGSPPRRAYPPRWRRGRVAEGGGLLNRYRLVKAYRGFESLRLRQPLTKQVCLHGSGRQRPKANIITSTKSATTAKTAMTSLMRSSVLQRWLLIAPRHRQRRLRKLAIPKGRWVIAPTAFLLDANHSLANSDAIDAPVDIG